jgi:GDPmannose 4,6-dehydratase
MWLMLKQDSPEDYVISTEEAHSVKEWVEVSFKCLDLDWTKYVKVDKRYIRPADVDLLVGDSSKAKKKLGWKKKVSFEQLVKIMVEYDYNYLKKHM